MKNQWQRYYPFFTSALLLWLLLVLLFPHYRYYIDPDGTAYLTVSARYASGDIARAVNGYWSPWACWLTAGLIQLGLAAIPASVVVNAAGATGFLWISQSFFLKFGIERRVQWLFCIALSIFLCYAVFWQSFDDLWECFFLLSVLRMMLADAFLKKPVLWIVCGIVGSLAYFAKAYSFPFFILNIVVCCWFLSKDKKGRWLLAAAIIIGAMVLCSMPWIYALHNKYGIWTTSTAGALNTSWYLTGHPEWKEGIRTLIPPVYGNSPYYWEDPWYANGNTPHFWNSWKLLGSEIVRSGYHVLLFLRSTLELSIFLPVIYAAVLWKMLRRQLQDRNAGIVALSFLLFPAGYVLVNLEARYLWYMLPLAMVLGAKLLERAAKMPLQPRMLNLLFAISIVVMPVAGMTMLYNSGAKEAQEAEALKNSHIQGSFTSNMQPRSMARLAYFSGDQYYFVLSGGKDYNAENVFEEMKRYHVQYFFHYVPFDSFTPFEKPELFDDSAMLAAHKAELVKVPAEGLRDVEVYQMK